ncbi:hypothetical protein ACQ4PT_058290 [Festuca glaucescens]
MVSSGGRGGRGGGRVGGTGSPSSRARELSAAEELERQRRADAARIRGSYRYLRQGCKPPRAFERRESRFHRDLQPSSSRGSTLRSTDPSPRRLTYSEASSSSASPPVPRFDPGDYAEDEDISMLAAKLEHAAPALMAGDFVLDSVLGTVTKLVEEQTRRNADKKAEWLREQAAQDACYIELDDSETMLGYSTGILSYVVPVFVAEIAPKDLRGGLATSNQLLICSGSSATYIVGALVAWRNLVFVGIMPCLLLLAGLPFIPESPRWLANVGREKEFRTSLQKLRGENVDTSEEAIEIKEYIESLQTFPKARIQDFFLSKNIYAVTVGVGLMIFQQLGGINGVGFYASSIFTSAGFSGKLGTILIGIIQIPITLFGAILMDRSGRRVLLMVSASGTFLGCFMTGISFYLKAHGLFPEWVPALALSGILVYIGAYSIGMGPVPWVVMSEIFSINMKATGGSLVTLVSWLGSFAISYSFSFLMDWSSAGTFFMFSAASLATILFVARLVPETKGRTLEEIQDTLNSRR